jgi:hypothetical protein
MTGILNAIFATFGGPGETTVEYLVIAGGGGGGYDRGGGGGAGGYRTNYTSSAPTPSPRHQVAVGLLNLLLLPHLELLTRSQLVLVVLEVLALQME